MVRKYNPWLKYRFLVRNKIVVICFMSKRKILIRLLPVKTRFVKLRQNTFIVRNLKRL